MIHNHGCYFHHFLAKVNNSCLSLIQDERYWTRRLKNNEAAKRSRDMRIKRERVVFEENQRLENMNKELRLEMDKFITENKELRLKMDIVMEDNARLKNLLISYQTADQVRRLLVYHVHLERHPIPNSYEAHCIEAMIIHTGCHIRLWQNSR